MSEVTPRDREEKLLAAIAEGATGKLPTPRNRKEKLLKEIYDKGGTGGGGVTPEQVKAILLVNTDNALNGASSNPIANKALVAALADYVKSTDLSIPTKVSELINDKKYQTDADLVTALTPYAKSDDVTAEIIAEIAKVVADAPESFNTLKEMSDWIAGHENDASAMNSAISDNKTAIASLQTGKADKSEIPTTVAQLTDSADYAKKTDLHSHDNKSVLDGITSDKVTYWDNKSEFSGSYNDLSDKPASLPANGGNSATVNGHTVNSDVPANAKFTDTTYGVATTSTNGLMSKDMVSKLNGIAEGANKTIVDANLSSTSTNPVQNKVVTSNLTDIRKETTVNLLNPTLKTTTQNGVTCTNNGDGTYTLNGTASDRAIFAVCGENFYALSYFVGDAKIVKQISSEQSIPGPGSDNNYVNGYYFAMQGKDQLPNIYIDEIVVDDYVNKTYRPIINVATGVTVDNVVFKPMLTTNLNATYDDFVPYTGDTGRLNGDVAELQDSKADKTEVPKLVKVDGKTVFLSEDGVLSAKGGETLASDVAEIKNDLGGLTFSASGTTLSITDGTHTWTLEANS